MDFNQLMAKMRELDSSMESQTVETECGAMPTAMPAPTKPETPPPSMSVNLNAQGMDNIEQMMKLFQKVNPDMMPQSPAPMPTVSAPPSIMSIHPDSKPINKLLPDLSDEPEGPTPDAMKLPPDHDKDHALVKTLDKDGDGDHDMDDHKKEEEAFANEPDETEYELDKIVFGGNDLHKEKGTFPKVAGGDNPMQKVSEAGDEAREYIRDVSRKIKSGEADPAELEKDFFNTLPYYDMDAMAIADAWERITGGEQRGAKKPADDIEADLKDLIKGTNSDDDDDDDIEKYKRQAKSGRIGMDTTGFGAELESRDDLRSKIREELQRRLAEVKSK